MITKRIALVIADNDQMFCLLSQMLHNMQTPLFDLFSLNYTNDIEAALNLVKAREVDIVLLDVKREVTCVKRLHRVSSFLPVVVWAEPDEEELVMQAIYAGVQDYLIQGQFDGRLLQRILHYSVQQSQQPQARLHQRVERLEIQHKINQEILAARQPQVIAQTVMRYIRQLLPVSWANVVIFDYETDEVITLAADTAWEKPQQTGINPSLQRFPPLKKLKRGEIYLINDLSKMADLTTWRRQLMGEGLQTVLFIPLVAQGELIGSLNLGADKPNTFMSQHIELVHKLTNSVALAIQQTRLHQAITARMAELEALAEVSMALRAAKSVDDMLPLILRKVIKIIGGVSGSIFLIDFGSNQLVARGTYPPDPQMQTRRRKLGQGITGRVAATGNIFISEDLMQDTMAHVVMSEVEQLQLVRSCIALPLRTQEHVIGVMHVGLPDRHSFTKPEVQLLTAVSEIAGNALDRAMVMETLEHRVEKRTSELAQANEQLKELDRLKSKFVSDVSHELRTPITNLNIYLDLLKQGDERKREHYLNILRKQGDRLIYLIESILDLSRLDMGREMVAFMPTDLNKLIDQVMAAHYAVAEAAGLELIADLQKDLPIIHGERNQLAQVITNLLSNAIRYTLEGYVRVSTWWDEEKHQVCLMVKDSGLGIAAEDLPHLFERFYRGERVVLSNIPGTGLGLAIVKEIVDLHGGQIAVYSETGSGSTFEVRLLVDDAF